MDVEQPDRHRPGAGAPPAHWPAKTRQLIDEIRLLCRDWLSEPLKVCLGDFDRALHEHAARTRSHIEQQRYQATRQRLVSERQAFEQRFVDCIDQALLHLGAQPAAAKAPPARLTLSLLDPLEHEMTGALDQLVARSAARGGPLLVELSYRLAVLVGTPPLESESMPLGPQAMAKAFRDSSTALGLPAEHHLLLLQAVEGRLIQGLTPLHEVINNHLATAGILPRLRPFPLPRGPRPPRRQRPLPAAPATEAAAPPARSGSLRELLARQRGPRPVSGHARFASPDEMQAALLALQRGRHADPVRLRHAQRLREALVDQLNAGQPIDAVPLLPGPDADDALELSARLFETLHRQLPPSSSAQALLDRVQLPMLAAAVIDGSFFDQPEQPARRLLDALLEAARDWIDGSDGGLALEPLLARLGSEPPTPALHAELRAELENLLAPLQRKAQVSERRHVEAMQGRERLEQARQRANELLAGLLAKAPPRAALRALLEHAWSDVLALTLLRHGEQSDTFARRLVITDQLLGRLPPGNLETLQAELVAGLQQIGMHGEEATQVAQRLIGAGAMLQDADAPGLTGLAMRLKQRRNPDESGAATQQATPAVPSAEALRLHQRLGQHAGGWFEFVEADGSRVRRKLAWYSPRAARGLFVTRQGQRAEEMSLAELAQAIGAGKVRELPAANESDLDRALRSLADRLRQANPMPGARS